jgi:hypothetical protein
MGSSILFWIYLSTSAFAQGSERIFQCDLPIEGERPQTVTLTRETTQSILEIRTKGTPGVPTRIELDANATQAQIPTSDPNKFVRIQWNENGMQTHGGCDAGDDWHGETSVTAEILDLRYDDANEWDDPCRAYRRSMQPESAQKIALQCY